MVTFNLEFCIGCRKCLTDCVVQAISIQNGKAALTGKCIKCGHCVAVCPVEAVSIPEYDMNDVESYCPETFQIQPEILLQLHREELPTQSGSEALLFQTCNFPREIAHAIGRGESLWDLYGQKQRSFHSGNR